GCVCDELGFFRREVQLQLVAGGQNWFTWVNHFGHRRCPRENSLASQEQNRQCENACLVRLKRGLLPTLRAPTPSAHDTHILLSCVGKVPVAQRGLCYFHFSVRSAPAPTQPAEHGREVNDDRDHQHA